MALKIILTIALNVVFIMVLIMDLIANHKISKRLDDIEMFLNFHTSVNKHINMRCLETIKRVEKLEERMKDEDSISM